MVWSLKWQMASQYPNTQCYLFCLTTSKIYCYIRKRKAATHDSFEAGIRSYLGFLFQKSINLRYFQL